MPIFRLNFRDFNLYTLPKFNSMDSFFISFLPQQTPKENKTIQAIVMLGQGLFTVL